ncbi:sigma-54-dependent transcriptional regulator [Desulfogranum mediterraneum]|uniref:sigma-54-dependent transcriptional regulator n=1 Tax=Desulfogranum mediterraneum TaxID=160661 RepID=UPI0003FD4923|nr:sigma-54 dependent transcriptional regulator [Desulfogranum mediterraneum]
MINDTTLKNLINKYTPGPALREQQRQDDCQEREQPALLIIDDDPSLRRGLASFFSHQYQIHCCADGPSGLTALEAHPVHCVILDIKMQGMDGFSVHKAIRKRAPHLPIIFHTAFQSEHDLKAIINSYAPFGYIDKGDDDERLPTLVAQAVAHHERHLARNHSYQQAVTELDRQRRDNRVLRQQFSLDYRFGGIVGTSAKTQQAIELCKRASSTDITVFIQGESGTGKELFSRAIHANSRRADRPFVVQNCAALADELLHSELFGHVKGAFTGAIADKKGLFETASGGTVFLDEVTDMPAAMQTSLLRVLEEGEIKPLGSNRVRQVDVRIISASNRPLQQAVEEQRFREDLYYRLNVFPVLLPPLRERREDIGLLIKYFLEENNSIRPSVVTMAKEARQCFDRYDFPGNIRELRNALQRALVMVDQGDTIELEHLAEPIYSPGATPAAERQYQGTLHEMVAAFEKDIITASYGAHQGNKSRTAKALGLSRAGLQNKLERYQISPLHSS